MDANNLFLRRDDPQEDPTKLRKAIEEGMILW